MATYYRWSKYTLAAIEEEDDISIGGSIVLNDSSNKLMALTKKPILKLDENNEPYYDFSTPSIIEITETSLSNYYHLSSAMYYSAYNSDHKSKEMVSGGRAITTSSHDKVTVWGSTTQYIASIGEGDFIEYVYSTSSSAYPNGGVSGGYYYGQRTTVESPTAPTGVSHANPITTTSVTVNIGPATSRTDYPVNLYEVSYSINGGSSWTVAGTTSGTSLEVNIPIGTTLIQFRVRARDSNNQWGPYGYGSTVQVLLAPTLTVPQMVMQGQQATVNWTAITGADSYTLQRKSSADADWTQVYSGANTTFSETAGTWTTVQYRVQAVFDGTPGGWATSAEIPVVSASALVISGQDGDLGTLVNDVPYSISTDTGNQITATITANGAVIFSGNVGNSVADVIPVLDLINGAGTIVIEASVTASSGPVSAVRTWTYTKTMMTFPNAGSIAELTKDGAVMWPETLAEAVRIPGGKTLDQVMGFPCQIYTGSYVGTGTYGADNPNTLTFPFEPKAVFIVGVKNDDRSTVYTTTMPLINGCPAMNVSFPAHTGLSYTNFVQWNENSVSWYTIGNGSDQQLNASFCTYYYFALG